jgi:hypothetical protein
MVLSCSSPPEPQAVVSKSQSMEEEEQILGPYQLPSRNNIARQYNRKVDNPTTPHSPTISDILDGVEDDDSVIMEVDKYQPNEEEEPQRSDDAKFSEEDDDEDDDDDDDDDEWGIDDPMFEQRIYESPRLISDDSDIFPPAESHASYQDPQLRWSLISKQAGPHSQDGSSLTVRRNMTPSSLRTGMMAQLLATRVRSLSLWLDHTEDILPQWLDVIATLFPNLEHLILFQDYFEGEEEIEVSSRMRRLYILYRLPGLRSIDGKAVTWEEQSIARPSTPNGERVENNDWMDKKSASLLDDEEDEGEEEYEDLAPPIPANASIGNATAMELGAELAQLTEKIAIIHDDDDIFDDQDTTDHRKTSRIMDEELAGELFANLTASNASLAGEQREDLSSDPGVGDSRDEDDQHNIHSAPVSNSQQPQSTPATATNIGRETGTQRSKRKSVQAPSRTASIRDHPNGHSTRSSRASTAQMQHSLLSQPSTADTLDLVSVASSHLDHEWSAACGVLSFRSDRACVPRLRLNFCGRGNRKRIADNKKEADRDSSFKLSRKDTAPTELDGLDASDSNHRPIETQQLRSQTSSRVGQDSTNVSNDTLSSRSPLRDKYTSTSRESSPNRQSNVDSPTPNQKLPPSKSLSSPFPMQFRDRTPSLRISTAETDLSGSKAQQNFIPNSPRARGSVQMDTITKPMTLTMLAPSRKKNAPSTRNLMVTSARHGNNSSSNGKLVTKGELPPPCPPAARRKVGAASLLQRDSQERKQSRRERKMARRKRAFQENARSTSVFDEMDDDSEDDSSSGEDEVEGPVVYSEEQYSSVHEGNDW